MWRRALDCFRIMANLGVFFGRCCCVCARAPDAASIADVSHSVLTAKKYFQARATVLNKRGQVVKYASVIRGAFIATLWLNAWCPATNAKAAVSISGTQGRLGSFRCSCCEVISSWRKSRSAPSYGQSRPLVSRVDCECPSSRSYRL
eukprot:IDg20967t1